MVIKRKSRRKRKSRKLRKSRTRVSKRNSKRRVSKKKGSYRRRSRKKSKQKKSVRSRSKKKLKGVSRVRRSKGSKPVPFAMRGGAAKYIEDTINKKTLTKLIEAAPDSCQSSITSIINEAEKRTAGVLEAMTTEKAQALLAGRDIRNTINKQTLNDVVLGSPREKVTEKCKDYMKSIIAALSLDADWDGLSHRDPNHPLLEIPVPQGVKPGQKLNFQNPLTGQMFQVVVPEKHNGVLSVQL